MKLLVILLCLLSERFLTHKLSFQRFCWLATVNEKLLDTLPTSKWSQNQWITLSALVFPWVLIVALLMWVFKAFLFGVLCFVFEIFIFYYCLGPTNAFYPVSSSRKKTKDDSESTDVQHYLAAVNNQIFSPIFWFITLGPLAVLAYRLIVLCQTQSGVKDSSATLTKLLDWIPARITVVLYLLVGNFEKGFNYLLKQFMTLPANNDHLLQDVGMLAAQDKDNATVSLPHAESLVEHAVIAYLVFLALFTMVSWL